jgi:hypothetical protein
LDDIKKEKIKLNKVVELVEFEEEKFIVPEKKDVEEKPEVIVEEIEVQVPDEEKDEAEEKRLKIKKEQEEQEKM